jgi:uncharacterized protein YgiM (DUF1202 family)
MFKRSRILAVLLTAGLSMSMLYGCNVNIYDGAGILKDDTKENESEEAAKEADNEEINRGIPEAMVGPELESVDYDLSNDYFECIGNSYLVAKDRKEDYAELAKALKQLDEAKQEEWKRNLDAFDEEASKYAKEQEEEGYDNTYSINSDSSLVYADDKIVSIIRCDGTFYGDAHPDYNFEAINLYSATGKEILLSDIITDKKGLDEILKAKIEEEFGDQDLIDLDEALADYDPEAEQFEQERAAYVFTLTPKCITFYFGSSELNDHAYGTQQVNIPYEDMYDIMDLEGFVFEEVVDDGRGDLIDEDEAEYVEEDSEEADEEEESEEEKSEAMTRWVPDEFDDVDPDEYDEYDESEDANEQQFYFFVKVEAKDGGVNLRSDATTKSKIIVKKIKNDTVLPVVDGITYEDTGKDWYKTFYRGNDGWIAASEVRKIDNEDVAPEDIMYFLEINSKDGSANIREEDGTHSKILFKNVKNGTILTCIDGVTDQKTGKDWLKVVYDGKTGWISETQIKYLDYVREFE